jgi:hypothetical protein
VSTQPRHRLAVAAAIAALLGMTTVDAQRNDDRQRVYRWVDSDGVVHYGDAVPPQFAEHDRDILNEQGVSVGFEEGRVTEAEQAEKARLAAIEDAERQARIATGCCCRRIFR